MKAFARYCKTHRLELVPDTLTCPIGHECEDDGFLSRERVVPERTPEQSRAVREGMTWVAGVFDSHGSCRTTTYAATKNGKRYTRLVVHISTADKMVLDCVQRLMGFGGVILLKARKSKVPGMGDHHTRWRYQAQNSSATRFLLCVKPFLRVKKIAVDNLLQGKVQGRSE